MTFCLSLKPGLADLTPAEAAEGWIELQEKYPNKVLAEQNFFIANTLFFHAWKVYPVLRSDTMSCPDPHLFKTLVSPACSGINTDWMDEFMQVRVSFVCLFFKNWRRYCWNSNLHFQGCNFNYSIILHVQEKYNRPLDRSYYAKFYLFLNKRSDALAYECTCRKSKTFQSWLKIRKKIK